MKPQNQNPKALLRGGSPPRRQLEPSSGAWILGFGVPYFNTFFLKEPLWNYFFLPGYLKAQFRKSIWKLLGSDLEQKKCILFSPCLLKSPGSLLPALGVLFAAAAPRLRFALWAPLKGSFKGIYKGSIKDSISVPLKGSIRAL